MGTPECIIKYGEEYDHAMPKPSGFTYGNVKYIAPCGYPQAKDVAEGFGRRFPLVVFSTQAPQRRRERGAAPPRETAADAFLARHAATLANANAGTSADA